MPLPRFPYKISRRPERRPAPSDPFAGIKNHVRGCSTCSSAATTNGYCATGRALTATPA